MTFDSIFKETPNTFLDTNDIIFGEDILEPDLDYTITNLYANEFFVKRFNDSVVGAPNLRKIIEICVKCLDLYDSRINISEINDILDKITLSSVHSTTEEKILKK